MTDRERHAADETGPTDIDMEMQRTAIHTGHAPETGQHLSDPDGQLGTHDPPVTKRRWTMIAAIVILLLILFFAFWR